MFTRLVPSGLRVCIRRQVGIMLFPECGFPPPYGPQGFPVNRALPLTGCRDRDEEQAQGLPLPGRQFHIGMGLCGQSGGSENGGTADRRRGLCFVVNAQRSGGK
jgi:hypothetical protein